MVKIGGLNINSLAELNQKIEGFKDLDSGAKAVLINGKSVKIQMNAAVKSEQRDKIIRAAITLAKMHSNLTIEERKDILSNILTKLNSLSPEGSSDPAVAKAIQKRQNLGRILYKREEKIEKAKASLDKMEKKLLDEVENSVKKQVIKYFKDCKSKNIGQDDNSLLTLKLELENQYRELFPALTEDSRNSAIEKGAHEAWNKVFKSGIKVARQQRNPIWPQEAKGPTESQIERERRAEENARREQEEAQRRAQAEEDRRAHVERMEADARRAQEEAARKPTPQQEKKKAALDAADAQADAEIEAMRKRAKEKADAKEQVKAQKKEEREAARKARALEQQARDAETLTKTIHRALTSAGLNPTRRENFKADLSLVKMGLVNLDNSVNEFDPEKFNFNTKEDLQNIKACLEKFFAVIDANKNDSSVKRYADKLLKYRQEFNVACRALKV